MPFEYAEKIGALTQEQRILFYELLAHNLTITARGIWRDESLTDYEKVEQLMWLNEISHRIIAKIRVTRLDLHVWAEEDVQKLIEFYVGQCPGIGNRVLDSILKSYKIASEA